MASSDQSRYRRGHPRRHVDEPSAQSVLDRRCTGHATACDRYRPRHRSRSILRHVQTDIVGHRTASDGESHRATARSAALSASQPAAAITRCPHMDPVIMPLLRHQQCPSSASLRWRTDPRKRVPRAADSEPTATGPPLSSLPRNVPPCQPALSAAVRKGRAIATQALSRRPNRARRGNTSAQK